MKSLKLFIVIVLMLGLNTTFAQLQKGNILIGGNVGFSLQFVEGADNFYNINVSPSLLGLITDNIAIGGTLGLSYLKSTNFSATSLGILPAARFYFPGANVNFAFYLDTQVGLQLINSNTIGLKDSDAVLAFGVGPGIAFFISEDVSIDTGLSFTRIGGDFDQSRLNFNMGLQVFLIGNERK